MKKINLKSKEIGINKKQKVSGISSLFLGLLFLFISSGSYGGVLYLKNKESDKIDFTNKEISQKKDQLDSEEFRDLYSFQSRLFELEKSLIVKESFSKSLANIEAFTSPGSYFRKATISLSDEYLEINSDIISPDYLSLSRQLEAYSEIKGVDSVILEDSKNSEYGLESRIAFRVKRDNQSTNENELK